MKAQKKRAAPKLELRESAGEADGALSAFVESLLETDIEKRPSSDAVVRRLGELRRLHPRPVLDLQPSSGVRLQRGLPRLRPSAAALRRRAGASQTARGLLSRTPASAGARRRAPREEPPQEGILSGIGSRPGVAGLVLALGILAFVAACALAAFLVFRR